MYGAGILCEGDNVSISNCIFTKNTAKYTGGAFQLDGDNNRVDNCIFLSNTGGHVGGAVAWVGNNGILTSSQFISSGSTVASQYGELLFRWETMEPLPNQYSVKIMLKRLVQQYIRED